MSRRTFLALSALSALFACGGVQAAPALLLQTPTISQSRLVFAYADDLWIAPREGGEARLLVRAQGRASRPHFSPDGRSVAYSARVGGNTDVYVVDVDGGEPKRLTWHPGDDRVVGWSPDGARVLFASNRATPNGMRQFYTVPLAGGPRDRAAARARRRRRLFAGRFGDRVHAASAVAARLERLPRRPDLADLDRAPVRFLDRARAARERHRPQSDVDRRHRLFPVRPRRPQYAVRLRHQDRASRAGAEERRLSDRLGDGRRGRDRLFADGRAAPVRPGDEHAATDPGAPSPPTARASHRATKTSATASPRRLCRRPARAPCSRRAAKSSACRPRRATCAT